MVFLNGWLLGLGLLAIGVPIVLHLMARQRPRPTPFPSIRFLSEAIVSNRRRIRLKQWILLALRIACLLWLASALAHPSVAAPSAGAWGQAGIWGLVSLFGLALAGAVAISRQQRSRWFWLTPLIVGCLAGLVSAGMGVYAFSQSKGTSLLGDEGPISAILVFDVSPRMEYVFDGKTRLQAAQELADQVLAELPEGSHAAIVDNSSATPFFSVDVSAARRQVESLRIRHVHQPIPQRVEQAAELFKDETLYRREVYVFSDEAKESWPEGAATAAMTESLKESEYSLYVINVRAERDDNISLTRPQLARESITTGGELELSVDVINRGEARSVTIELELEQPDLSRPTVRDGEVLLPEQLWNRSLTIDVPENGTQSVSLSLPDLPLGVHQGRVVLRPADALEWDNVRYFTIDVREPWKCLVFAAPETRSAVLTEAISPLAERLAGRSVFEFENATFEEFGKYPLEDFEAVFLVDPSPIDPATWELLRDYVIQGGSVALFLGASAERAGGDELGFREIDPSFQTQEAASVLPGTPTHVWFASEAGVWLTPRDFAHPLLAPLRGYETTVPWREFPIRQHWGWEFTAPAGELSAEEESSEETASTSVKRSAPEVVLSYSDGTPAVIESSLGAGSVIVWTTPIGERVGATSPDRWNQLTVGDCWPYFLLVNQLATVMVADQKARLNLTVGETGDVTWRGDDPPEALTFFSPLGGEPERIRGERGTWLLRFTETPGAYRFKGGVEEPRVLGFAVNTPETESDLNRVDDQWWSDTFPEGDVQRATGVDELRRKQGTARQGQDFFETLVLWFPLLLATEFLFGSFSQSRGAGTTSPSPRSSAKREVAA